MSAEKNFDDVGQLVDRLHLDGLKYREFGEHRPAQLKLAVSAPAVTAAAAPAVAAAPSVPTPTPTPTAAVLHATEPARAPVRAESSSRTIASPLNFTFERLRRQVIGSRVHAPVLQLQLAPRKATAQAESSAKEKPVSELFARLSQSPDPANPGRPLKR